MQPQGCDPTTTCHAIMCLDRCTNSLHFLAPCDCLELAKIKAHGHEAILDDEAAAAADKLALDPMYGTHPDPKPSQHSKAHHDKMFFNDEIAHSTTYGLQRKRLPHEFQYKSLKQHHIFLCCSSACEIIMSRFCFLACLGLFRLLT